MSEENIYQAPASDLFGVDDLGQLIYAGFWIRVGAYIIDAILLMLITFPLLTIIYGTNYWLSESYIQGGWDFFVSYILPAIVTVLFWVYKSATPGKMLLGLKVIRLGEPHNLGVGQAIGRYVAYYLSAIPLCIGFIWIAFDARKQGWHDKLANTVVIKK
jgi:uncharacterized RDD family membrane protein YckC